MTERLINNAVSTLAASTTNVATSITVANGSVFSGSGTFRVLIDSEILLVTAVTGNVLTVTRGAEGTTAMGHSANATVTAVVTAGGIVQAIDDRAGDSNFSGSYDDLTDKPTIPTLPIAISDVTNLQASLDGKANSEDLAEVATTGDYGDLQNTPSLSTVAGTGSYDDLTDKPTIPTLPITIDDVTGLRSEIDDKALQSYADALATAIDGKQPTITGAASSITSSNLATSKALVSDGSGKVAASSVTSTELGYVSGVTSALQTQLNAKAATSSLATVATSGSYSDLSSKPTIPTLPIAMSDVTNLQTSLDGKAASSHTHAVADITDLQNTLNGKVAWPDEETVEITDAEADGTDFVITWSLGDYGYFTEIEVWRNYNDEGYVKLGRVAGDITTFTDTYGEDGTYQAKARPVFGPFVGPWSNESAEVEIGTEEPLWSGIPGDDPDVSEGDPNIYLGTVQVTYGGEENLDMLITVDEGTQFSETDIDLAGLNAAFSNGDYDFSLGIGGPYDVAFFVRRTGQAEWADEQHVTFEVVAGCECTTPSIDDPADAATIEWTGEYQCSASNNGCDDPATETWSIDDDTNFTIEEGGRITDNGGLDPGDYPLTITYDNECGTTSISVTITIPE